jgi:GTP-binding protein HflX
MNVLTDAGQDARDMLFATLDTKTVRWNLGGGRFALLSDTVGFVRNLPHKLVASFRATLEEAIHADLLLHVVDASARDALRQIEVVRNVLNDLGCADRPTLTLLNKVDAVEDHSSMDVAAEKYAPTLRISARTGRGLDQLADYVTQQMQGRSVRVTIRFPAGEGKLVMQLGQWGQIHAQEYEDSLVRMDVTLQRSHFAQLQSRYPTLEVLAGGA